MKAMLTVTLFGGGDPAVGERRTMTIGGDPLELPRRVAEWAHDVVARMSDAEPEPVDIEPETVGLWGDAA